MKTAPVQVVEMVHDPVHFHRLSSYLGEDLDHAVYEHLAWATHQSIVFENLSTQA